MAKKLYPPNIEGTIPAFYGTTLVVPFSMNKAVSENEIHSFTIKIKTVQSGTYIISKDTEIFSFDPSCYAVFDLSEEIANNKLNVGQYYKVQMAAIDESEIVGYFSTVGVVKYTAEPRVYIDGLETGRDNINMHQYEYIGVYYQNQDVAEKAYSYHFNLYNNEMMLLQTSGEIVHNISLDVDLIESHDAYIIEQDLKTNKSYYLEYVVTTLNGLVESSGLYRIMQKKSIDPEIKAGLIPELNFENGYVDVKLQGHRNAEGVEYAATGAFKILRASEEDGYAAWHEVLKFALYGQQPSRWIWKDFTVKQGVTYKYALQQYSDYLSSNRLESEPIYVDYEHAFLYDGERQLKIKYNPKMTSFKNDLLESKMDTIGGKHPFIFRNGNVKYKEFPLSGLISCQLDEENLFIAEEDLGRYDNTINLTGENIASEREFKLEVLEWLNNGKPKLFRSPTEGNYIVRLLNVSLAPNDTVGRMLHTFTATAYEIADYTYSNLSAYGLISVGDPTVKQLRWETIDLAKSGIGSGDNILNYKAVSLYFEGMVPGDIIHIEDGIVRYGYNEDGSPYRTTGFDVTIGVTGSYIIDLSQNVTVNAVTFKGSMDNINADNKIVQHQGSLTYAYYSKVQNRFDTITDIAITNEPLVQFIGQHDIIEEIEDVKVEIQDIYWIHAMLREICPAYYRMGKIPDPADPTNEEKYILRYNYYTNKEIVGTWKTDMTYLLDFDSYVLYYVLNVPNNSYFYLDGHSKKQYSINDYSPKIYFNGNEMDLSDTSEYTIKNPQNIKSIISGNGIMVEMSYQKQTIEYSVESNERTYPDLVKKKIEVFTAYQNLYDAIYNFEDDDIEAQEIEINHCRAVYDRIYEEYIVMLEQTLEAEEAAQGDIATQ